MAEARGNTRVRDRAAAMSLYMGLLLRGNYGLTMSADSLMLSNHNGLLRPKLYVDYPLTQKPPNQRQTPGILVSALS
jgi:hypothetical protein